MILDELVLHNFGVYRGRQQFNLTPEGPERPIILVGAQNGSGKTTFLEGLQLAFFGRQALSHLRGGGSYEDYLRRAINRAVPAEEGAEVQAKFRRVVAGQEQVFVIRRAWSVQKTALKEVFEVVVDGKFDRVLTEQWGEFVEDMLPPRIAPLFFFDGERIEQFADLHRSAEVIATAVNALLGLDIVERLTVDLEVLERRKKAAAVNKVARDAIAAAEAAVHAAEDAAQVAYAKRGAAKKLRDRREAQLERARQAFASEGGELFRSRESISEARTQVGNAIEGLEKSLRAWAADCAPLLLIPGLLAEVAEQATREVSAQETRTVLRHLDDRDQRTLDLIGGLGADPALLERVTSYFEQDRAVLMEIASASAYLNLPPLALGQLDLLLTDSLSASARTRDELLEELEALESQMDTLERKLASIPAPEAIAPALAAVEQAEAAFNAAEDELADAAREDEGCQRAVAAARAAYQGTLDRHVQHRLQAEDAQRTIEHASRARSTLERFRREVVRHHVHRIETLILEALRELLRKDDLIVDVRINPETFAIELRGGGWDAIPPEQLSAGERQLFAVALLWALAKASGQAAPTVIDTPLGRLDSKHRGRLVERYFGRAGKQVILLSTDEEIDGKLYAQLEPWLSRSFTIGYDAELRGSQVRPGYAFAEADTLEVA